jgi:translocation and assembly module TamB
MAVLSQDRTVSVSDLCLQNEMTVICADAFWKDENKWNGSISITDIPMELLNTYLPRNINSSGHITLAIDATQEPGQTLRGSGSVNSNTAEIRFRVDEGIIQVFDLENVNGSMDLQNGVLDGQLNMIPSDTQQHPLVASVKLSPVTVLPPDVNMMDIEGSLSWEVDDLSFASAISPYLTDVTGRLVLDMSVFGALKAPGLSGELVLQDATMMFPEFGIELFDVNLTGTPSPVNNFRLTGNARSGEGNLSIDATASTSVQGGQNVIADIRGENFEVINTPEIRSNADTELKLMLNNQRTRLEGQLDIHDALIDLNEIRDTATLSEDVILVDASGAAPPEKKSRSDLRLHLNFNDNIEIRGQGIRGSLSGGVMITSTENGILLGIGEVSISDGRYSAYGQTLEIEEGRLIYNNYQMDNPELRIRAVKVVNEDITVGLTVTGFLSDPQVTLISTPAMSDEDTLAYLVFGRPVAELTSGEGLNLIGAATSLGVKNSGFITRNLSSTFGLDTLELSSDSNGENVALTVGKYVTPKLYLSYVVGVLESYYTARIRYNVTRRWSLEAKSGEAVGVDLFYSIEK